MERKIYRELGVFGPRNSGKTTFWACLYGSKGSAEGSASFTDEPTVRLLDSFWQSLNIGNLAPATAQGVPLDLSFQLHSQAITWHVSTKDYSGNLVELTHLRDQGNAPAVSNLRGEIARWIRSCDAMLVLIPADLASQSEQARVDFRRALEALMEVFRNSDHPGPLPVCLAVTKSDMLPCGSGFAGLEYGPNDDLPTWLQEHIDLARNQVGQENAKVYFTSAFGGHAEGDASRPPQSGPGPKHLEVPLVWVLQESDRCLFEAAAKAEQNTRRWPHGYTKAIRQCERVAAKGLSPTKYAELQALQGKLTNASWAQTKRRTMLACCLVLAVAAIALYLHADSLKLSADSAIATDKVTRESVNAVEGFLESRNPACSVFFKSAQERFKTWYSDRTRQESGRTMAMIAENPDDPSLHWQQRVEGAKRRVSASKEFSNLFPKGTEGFQFQKEERSAKGLIADLERYGPFDDDFLHLTEVMKAERTSERMQKFFDDFSVRYPRDKFPLRIEKYSQVKEMIKARRGGDEFQKLLHRAVSISADYSKDPKGYSRHLEAIAAWLGDYEKKSVMLPEDEASLRKPAEELRGLESAIGTAWDKELYETLKTSSGRMFEDEGRLRNAISDARDYLTGIRKTLAMKEHVQDWLAYAGALLPTHRVGLQAHHIKVWGKMSNSVAKESIQVSIEVMDSPNSQWAQWNTTGVKTINNEGNLADKPNYVTVPLIGQIKIDIEKYNVFGPNSRTKVVRFLELMETYQKAGETEANVAIEVDGAKLLLKLTELPRRKNLPPYGEVNH